MLEKKTALLMRQSSNLMNGLRSSLASKGYDVVMLSGIDGFGECLGRCFNLVVIDDKYDLVVEGNGYEQIGWYDIIDLIEAEKVAVYSANSNVVVFAGDPKTYSKPENHISSMKFLDKLLEEATTE